MIGKRGVRQGERRAETLGVVHILDSREWTELTDRLKEDKDYEVVSQGVQKQKEGQRTDERGGGWTISSISATPKYSEHYIDCTGLFVVGVDKSTGEIISMLTHQTVSAGLDNATGKAFDEALRVRLAEFKKRAKPGSITVGFFGGMKYKRGFGRASSTVYDQMKNKAERAVHEMLGMKLPVVSKPFVLGRSGPKSSGGAYIGRNGVVHLCDEFEGKGLGLR